MDLVEKEDGSSAIVAKSPICRGENLADPRNPDLGRVLSLEVSAKLARDQQCQRGLASSGRSVEEQGANDAGVEHSPKHLALPKQVLLAHQIFDVFGAQSMRERLCRPSSKVPTVFPEILHDQILSVETGGREGSCGASDVIGSGFRPFSDPDSRGFFDRSMA
jgi:hypothetical protein